ncbi:adenylyltransferase/sulfurtransferase MoeZ [Microbacterium kribbense]|uniref:Adenylyltransferase/sulfurtransferase MoeZ n=1 Tax=Microbacterium kribbense TaxID=433645 RepID=A0ABP7GLD8_9MICO
MSSTPAGPAENAAEPGRPPAVVAVGPELAPQRLARYGRQLLLPGFTADAQRRLAGARVLVVGAGGLGSASIPYLAGAGVGTIGIIDTDVVELSNLHRQVSHGIHDLGRSKVASLADTIAEIDPEITVRRHEVRLDSSNALDLFAGYDLIMDGSDNFATRYLTNDAAALAGLPLVWGAILRYSGQASVAYAAYGPNYRDLFPTPPAPGEVLSCSVGGVLPGVCATIGAIMSTEAVKLITGIGEPLIGRVTTYDARTGRFRELGYRRSPDAAPITELIDYELFCGQDTAPKVARDSIDAPELAALLAAGAPLQLVDVREPFEAQIARIDGATLIPLGTVADEIEQLRSEVPVVVYCHFDSRSRRAAEILRAGGITGVQWLEGGIDAYARLADTSLARY